MITKKTLINQKQNKYFYTEFYLLLSKIELVFPNNLDGAKHLSA
jgi:hypothetical protein